MRAMILLLVAVAILTLGLVSTGSVRAQALLSAVWQLTKMPGETEHITASSRYTIQFLPDGTVAIGADCNRATGPWQTSGPTVNITITQSTLARCATGSLAEEFLQALDEAATFTVVGTTLTLESSSWPGDKKMVFTAAPL